VMAEALEMEEYESGQIILEQGAVGDKFYIIKEGKGELWETSSTLSRRAKVSCERQVLHHQGGQR
jgi:hypothetical protein